MRKHVWLLLALCMAFSLILPVSAAEAEGTCGEGITWSLNGGTLTVSGEGAMADCPDTAPWDAYKDQITKVVFTGGITYIGSFTFDDYDKLTSIDFGSALYEIGESAFRNCDGLTSLSFPASFKIFGPDSLRNCKNLTALHCAGRFPSLRLNCLWDTYVTIYYPASRPWGEGDIRSVEAAFHGRLVFLNSDGIDPYAPEETTAETTEETTEATTEATTAPTEVTTAPTEVTTSPAETQPGSTATSGEQPTDDVTAPSETEPQQEEPKKGINLLAVISGTVAVVMLIIIGVIAYSVQQERRRRARRRRRRR